jgi:hypothetical protein
VEMREGRERIHSGRRVVGTTLNISTGWDVSEYGGLSTWRIASHLLDSHEEANEFEGVGRDVGVDCLKRVTK